MAIYEYRGVIPVVHPSAYIHPQATVLGEVTIGKDVYIGPGCVLRGDIGSIIIKDGCNVQENCTVHMFPGEVVTLEEMAHIGHGAVVHGANVGKNCLIGMNAVLMDHSKIGNESIVGALAFVKEGMEIPPRSLVVGNPAKIIKEVSDEMIKWKTEGTKLYQTFPEHYRETLKEVQPLTDPSQQKKQILEEFKSWKETIQSSS